MIWPKCFFVGLVGIFCVSGADEKDFDQNNFIRKVTLSKSRNHIAIEPLSDAEQHRKNSMEEYAPEYLEIRSLRRAEEGMQKEPKKNFFTWLFGCCSDRGKNK